MDATRRIRDYDTGEIGWSSTNETTTLRSGKVLRKRAEKILGNKVTAKAAEKEAKRSRAKQRRLRKMRKKEKKLSNF